MTVHLRIHTQDRGMLPGLYPEPFQYPGGEWSLRNIPDVPGDQGQVTFIADVRGASTDDLLKAALWADVAHRGNFWHESRKDPKFVLMVPYLPAARADKADTSKSPVGASVYASLIRAMGADEVITIDPHSPFMPRLIHPGLTRKVTEVSHLGLLREALESRGREFDAIICPDRGAELRADAVAQMMGKPLIPCDKHRDPETGKILGLKVPPMDPQLRYLVVDDICDGGGTFALLAEKIGLPREQMGLWVTHGIFSGNAHLLREHYGWIGTTDSHPGTPRPVAVWDTQVPCFMAMFNKMGVK